MPKFDGLKRNYPAFKREWQSCITGKFDPDQGGRSWRASGDRQISLNASAERAFANFRDKKTPYFTIANFCNINIVFLR